MGTPKLTTSTNKERQPEGPPRGGMEDGPNRTDNTELTNEQRILRSCSCGWSNVTTYRGLRIHQGKAKCGGKGQRQTCTAQAGRTRRSQSRVEYHSAIDFNIADGQRKVEQPHQQQAQGQQQAHSLERVMQRHPAAATPQDTQGRDHPDKPKSNGQNPSKKPSGKVSTRSCTPSLRIHFEAAQSPS